MAEIVEVDSYKYRVTLSNSELALGTQAGMDRFRNSRELGLSPGECDTSEAKDIDFALSELAVALLLGQNDFIPTVGSFHDPDIILPNGTGLQVRATNHPKGGLIWREGDKSTDIFVLAVGSGREWMVLGWALGSEIKSQGRYEIGHRSKPCWILPKHRLEPLFRLDSVEPYLPEDVAVESCFGLQ